MASGEGQGNGSSDITGRGVQSAEVGGRILVAMVQAGRPLNWSTEIDRELTPIAWQRMVTLNKAADLGLVAGNNEVVQSIED